VLVAAHHLPLCSFTSKLLDQRSDVEEPPQFGDFVICHMELVDSNEREMPAGRGNTEDFSAVRALQAPARCGPARIRHYIFDGVLLIGSGLMVPHQELFVTLQALLAFFVIGWVKDETQASESHLPPPTRSLRRVGLRFRCSSEQSIRWTFVSTSCTCRANVACLCSATVRRMSRQPAFLIKTVGLLVVKVRRFTSMLC
jgi:hypothetical protein